MSIETPFHIHSDVPQAPADLNTIWNARAIHYGQSHGLMDELVSIYNGHVPDRFMDFFHDEIHEHLINMIRLAADDLTNLTAKTFPLYVPPQKGTEKAKQEAEKVENICYGYNDAGRKRGSLDMQGLMGKLAWWLVLCADAVAMVLPDYRHQTPWFTFRDPRTHFPPVGWGPWSDAPLDGTLFAYRMSLSEIKMRYPDRAGELSRAYTKYTNAQTSGYRATAILNRGGWDDNQQLWVGEYYSNDAWYVATLEDQVVTLAASESGDKSHPGVVPVVPFTLYNPGSPKGRSLFADQISIQAAMSRMFSQKLDYFDHILYGELFTTPLTHPNVKMGPNAVNIWDVANGVTPKVERMQPKSTVDADQMMGLALNFSRMLNRNPESFQGQGEANSAKAIAELKSGVNSTVQDGFWPSFQTQLPKLYAAAARMDRNIWGNEKKMASGKKRNTVFQMEYVPNIHLAGHEDSVQIEPGVGLGGYQGTLEIMQRLGAELMPIDDALEALPDIRNPQETKRRLQQDRLEKTMWADLEAKAAQGMLQPGAFAQIRRLVSEKDSNIFDAMETLEIQGKLYVAPPSLEGAQGPGGPVPPELMAAMGQGLEAGGVPGQGMPSLEALRG